MAYKAQFTQPTRRDATKPTSFVVVGGANSASKLQTQFKGGNFFETQCIFVIRESRSFRWEVSAVKILLYKRGLPEPRLYI